MPGSFEYYDSTNNAYITYILEAKLSALNSNNSLSNTTLLIVNQSPQTLEIERQKTNSSNLTTCYCFERGYGILSVNIPKDRFFTYDTIIADCQLDNRNTSLDTIQIKVELAQKIHLKDNYGRSLILERNITQVNFRNLYRRKELHKFSLEIPVIDQNNPTNNLYRKMSS